MSISVYSLATAINESAVVGTRENIPAYEFCGSLIEACYEMDFNIMSESASVDELLAVSNEIMAEAAVSNPTVIEVLQENVFTSVKDGVVKFFKKIIAMIKGIIEKLKAAFYKMTNKIDEWYKIMEPKVKAAKNRVSGDFTVEMYDWNAEFVTKTFPDEAAGAVDGFDAEFKITSKIEKVSADMFQKLQNIKPEDAAKASEQIAKEAEDTVSVNEKVANYMFARIGHGKSESAQNFWAEMEDKARGTSEKRSIAINSKVDDMLAVVKDSKNTIDKLKKAYEKHEKDITKIKDSIEKLNVESYFTKGQNKTRENEEKFNASVNQALVEAIQKKLTYSKNVVSEFEKWFGQVKNKNIAWVQSMTQDYMSALTKFAGAKAEKK